jgi:serine/threonine protein kinase
MPASQNPPSHALEAVVTHDGRRIARCLVRRGRYVIGHERRNEIIADEPSISGQHARLTVVSDDEIYIEDLGSANGTFVDGRPAQGMTRIPPDAEVHLGAALLSFERAGLPATIFDHLPEGFLRKLRYERGEVIVQGSTSTICEARDTSLGRVVAVKVMLPESQHDSGSVLRFIREAQIAGQLQHSGVLPIYELGLDEQRGLFYTTRFVEGETLAEFLSRLAANDEQALARFSLHHLLNIWQRVCDAVAYAHSRGVIHGTLRPEAVEVGIFGEVFVTHWGSAITTAESPDDPDRVFVATIAAAPPLCEYTAPEQAGGQFEDIDERTDVFALGGLLYRILTLCDPLATDDDDALLEAALNARITPPAELQKSAPCPHWPRGKLPEFPAAVAMKALRLARDERHATVHELQQEIAVWQDQSAVGGELGKVWKQFTGLLGRE